MKLIVGLGNLGEKYLKSRHNIGFMVLERLLKDFEPVEKTAWQNEDKFKSDIAEIDWQSSSGESEKIILAKPKTYMNNSGTAVELLAHYFKIEPKNIWIVHDDIDLLLGKIKIRLGGGSAGHKGIESVMKSLGTDAFVRFRLGIGKPFKDPAERDPDSKAYRGKRRRGRRMMEKVDEYVLSSFAPGETHEYKELVKKGAKALEMALAKGIEVSMNRFNAK